MRFRYWAGLLSLLAVGLAPAVYASQLRAGAARVNITPLADEFPSLGPGGRYFIGVHDDVFVRALVLEDGNQRIALVMMETTKVPASVEMLKAAAGELGAPESNVLVAASHTHNVLIVNYFDGPTLPVHLSEIKRIQHAVAEAVRMARAQMKPARIAFGRGESWMNQNGGSYMQAGVGGTVSVQEDIYFPEGPSDKSVDVIRVEALTGEPVALLVNYATHGEVMFRSVTKNNGYEISGDLPGAVSHLLEGTPAGAPVVLFTSGAEADQLPLFKSLQPTGQLSSADEGAGGWALLDAQARRLANTVLDTLAGMKAGATDVRLSALAGSATCPGKVLHLAPGEKTDKAAPPVNIPLSLVRINDIVLAGVGGDLASEIGQRFKSASPLASTTLITMAAGDVGYIMTDALYRNQGYGENHGVGKSPVKPGCAEPAIIKGLLGLLEKTRNRAAEPEKK